MAGRTIDVGSFEFRVVTGRILFGAIAIGIYNWWRGAGKWYCCSLLQRGLRLVQEHRSET